MNNVREIDITGIKITDNGTKYLKDVHTLYLSKKNDITSASFPYLKDITTIYICWSQKSGNLIAEISAAALCKMN